MKAWLDAKGRGPVEIEAGKTGQFDILVDGKLAYSRHANMGRFPGDADLEKLIA